MSFPESFTIIYPTVLCLFMAVFYVIQEQKNKRKERQKRERQAKIEAQGIECVFTLGESEYVITIRKV